MKCTHTTAKFQCLEVATKAVGIRMQIREGWLQANVRAYCDKHAEDAHAVIKHSAAEVVVEPIAQAFPNA
jgi:phosphoglucomutase